MWRSITTAWHLDERELLLLAQAAATADRIAELEAALTEHGVVVAGAAGQPRLNAVVTEIRGQRLTLEKLLSAMSLPVDDTESPRVSRRQQLRAQRRWTAS